MAHAILIFFLLVILVMSDSAWSLSDELSAPETDLPLNDEMLAFNQPTLAMNLNASPQDGSNLFFEDVDNSGLVSDDDNDVRESWELAGCSSSESFPALGKSRMRRRDESTQCKSPTSVPPTGSIPPFDPSRTLLGSPGMMQLLNTVKVDRVPNNVCVYLSRGVLPFAVCHSGNGVISTTLTVTIVEMTFSTVNLQHCSPGKLKSKRNLIGLITDFISNMQR